MIKRSLTFISVSALSGCGVFEYDNSGIETKFIKQQELLISGSLRIASTSSNIKKDSVIFYKNGDNYYVSNSIDGSLTLSPLFNDLDLKIKKVNFVSDTVVITTYEIADFKYAHLITYINDEETKTYQFKNDSYFNYDMNANVTGNKVILFRDDYLAYIEKGVINNLDFDNSVRNLVAGSNYIAFFDDENSNIESSKSDYRTINLINLSTLESFKLKDKFKSILGFDDNGELFVSMSEIVPCHPIDAGLQENIDGIFEEKSCDVNTKEIATKTNGKSYNQSYHMIPVAKIDIKEKSLKPWVYTTNKSDSHKSNHVFDYINGHVLFSGIKQDIRNQHVGSSNFYKEYRGEKIPLVDFTPVCLDDESYYSNSNVFLNDNAIICFQNSFDNSDNFKGVLFKISKLNSSGDYVEEYVSSIDTGSLKKTVLKDAENFNVTSYGFFFDQYDYRFSYFYDIHSATFNTINKNFNNVKTVNDSKNIVSH